MLECLAALAPLLVEAEDTSLQLSWIDAFFIIFFGFGFISAHRLGLFGELPRAAAWIASLGLGLRWYPYVATQIEQTGKVGPDAAAFYGFLLIGVFFLSVGYVIGMTITKLRKKAVEGGADLWGGFIFGPVKMVAAYFWVVVALLLLPSVWTRKHIGLDTFSGGLVSRYCSDVRERVYATAGKKDSLDTFIERKRRKAQEEIDQMEPEEDVPPSDNPTGEGS
jgi:uncharacterized membrane protein required for colicin V production